jgi:hypothetical protein
MPPPGYQPPQLRRQSTSPQLVRRAFVPQPLPSLLSGSVSVDGVVKPKAIVKPAAKQALQPPPRVRRARLVPNPPPERELTVNLVEVPDEEDSRNYVATESTRLLPPQGSINCDRNTDSDSDSDSDSGKPSSSSNYSLFGLLVLGFFWVSG